MSGVGLLIETKIRYLLRRAEQYVCLAAVAAPAVSACVVSKMRVSPCHAAIELFLKFICSKIGSRVAQLPEMIYEFGALLVGGEAQENLTFVARDEVGSRTSNELFVRR